MERIDFEGNRLPIPTQLVRNATNSGLIGSEKLDRWLLLISSGRFRLTTAEAISNIRHRIEAIESPEDALQHMESDVRNACPARLMPCTVSPPPPLWRLNFPHLAALAVSDSQRPPYVFAFVVAGCIELWFPDSLRRAVSTPLADILR